MDLDEIKKVMIIGSGPIVIGQSAEFDYSGNQAIKVLLSKGIEVVIVNSNPATIQTDPRPGLRPYMVPMNPESIEEVIKIEKPDAIMGTFGGQTALNLITEMNDRGLLKKYNIKVLGTSPEAIKIAEDRLLFKEKMKEIGEPVLESFYCRTINDAILYSKKIGFPIIVRPSFTLGGTGGGIANDSDELRKIVSRGISLSQVNSVLIEKSVIGWKELEVEVIRDSKGNKIAVCTMENVDPMGVHTGDSIVVTPFLTLNDKLYQKIRQAALKIAEAIEIIGSCNVQFALNPNGEEYYVIEVNPRLSRSSALASKATGYPIARVAALIALGYSLDEIENNVTGEKNAAREPSIDYVVVKFPVWPIEKFPDADFTLGTQMKSTGEVMAIGRTLRQAFRKALKSTGLLNKKVSFSEERLKRPNPLRVLHIYEAYKMGYTIKKIAEFTGWQELMVDELIRAFEDEEDIKGFGIVDTCAGEFEAITPYYYSKDDGMTLKVDVLVLGSGPITIGQGIEFDYSTVNAIKVLREMGLKVAVLNDNPETVSTDFDESDVLIFDPVEYSYVKNAILSLKPDYLIPWFGGQRPINMLHLIRKDFPELKIPGTEVEVVDILEDRNKFAQLMNEMGIPYPIFKFSSIENIRETIKEIGYPIIIRPSYTISGAHMAVIKNDEDLKEYLNFHGNLLKDFLVEKYLENSIEAEIDAVSDGKDVFIPGIIEHIEEAGIHSGDSTSIFPSVNITRYLQETMKEYTKIICRKLNIVGPLNIQFAIKNDIVYIIEINPRSSRTFPFVSKVSGVNLAMLSSQVIMKGKLEKTYFPIEKIGVKIPIFPFDKITNSDVILGPEMRSTGEVIGIGKSLKEALLNGYLAAGYKPFKEGVIVTIAKEERPAFFGIVKMIYDSGRVIYATDGTHQYLKKNGIPSVEIKKLREGSPNIMDLLEKGDIAAVINILNPNYRSEEDGKLMRRACYEKKVLYLSTRTQAAAFANAIYNEIELKI